MAKCSHVLQNTTLKIVPDGDMFANTVPIKGTVRKYSIAISTEFILRLYVWAQVCGLASCLGRNENNSKALNDLIELAFSTESLWSTRIDSRVFQVERDTPTGELCWQIFRYAFTFIVTHECAHITAGHVDFLDNFMEHFASLLDEPDRKRSAIIRTLENDADCAGAKILLDEFLKDLKRYGNDPAMLSDISRLLALAQLSVFLIFHKDLLSNDGLWLNKKYLHPHIRFMNTLALSESYAKHFVPSFDWQTYGNKCLMFVYDVVNRIDKIAAGYEQIVVDHGGDFSVFGRDVERRWGRIRRLLKPYAYVNLAEPGDF